MRKIDNIVVHCSDTPKGMYFDVDDIREWHKSPKPEGRGWSDVGYHYVVLLDGTIQIGRSLEKIGAHVKGHNLTSIAVCYVGGGDGVDTRTIEQKVSLIYLIGSLKRTYKNSKVLGHRDFSIDSNNDGEISEHEWMKECPSFNAIIEYKNI